MSESRRRHRVFLGLILVFLSTATLPDLRLSQTTPSHPILGTSSGTLASEVPSNGTISRDVQYGGPSTGPSTSVQTAPSSNQSAIASPTVGQNLNITMSFEGIDSGLDSTILGQIYSPPDVQVAAGPSYVLEMVNSVGEIYAKNGSSVQKFALYKFFNITRSDTISDPKILFDAESGRWFGTITDLTDSSVHIATSQTNDPTGGWYHSSLFVGTSLCPDQPVIGVSSDQFAVSVNVFSSCLNNVLLGAEYWILEKSDLVTGITPHFVSRGPNATLFSVHPVQSLSPTQTLYMASTNSSTSVIRLFTVTGTPRTTVHINETDVSVLGFSNPPAAVEPGIGRVDTGDSRIQDVAWYQGKLWLAFNDGCTPSGDFQTRSCFRVIEMNTDKLNSAGSAVDQDFDVGGTAGQYYFYPGLRIDSLGDLIVVFGRSSILVYPGIMLSGQSTTDNPGTWRLPQIVQLGSGTLQTIVTGRYGDYFGAGVDPSNPRVIWVAGEYLNATPATWQTRIASATFAPHESAITLSYLVQGGEAGFTPPILTYTVDGIEQSKRLTTQPTTYIIPDGTEWNVTTIMLGASPGERWTAGPLPSRTVSSSENIVLVYYHQYKLTFTDSFTGGGTPASPQITYEALGTTNFGILPTDQSLWSDAGSSWSVTNPIVASSTERWHAPQPTTAVVNSTSTVSIAYQRQFNVKIGRNSPEGIVWATGEDWHDADSLAPVGTPGVYGEVSGTRQRVQSYSVDSGSPLVVSPTTGLVLVTLKMDSAHTLVFNYATQYFVAISGGSLSPSSTGDAWFDAGSEFTVNAAYPHSYRANYPSNVYVLPVGFQIVSNATASSVTWSNSSEQLSFAANNARVTVYVPPALKLIPLNVTDNGQQVEFQYSSSTGLLTFTGASQFKVSFTAPPTPAMASEGLGLEGTLMIAALLAVAAVSLMLVLGHRRRKVFANSLSREENLPSG